MRPITVVIAVIAASVTLARVPMGGPTSSAEASVAHQTPGTRVRFIPSHISGAAVGDDIQLVLWVDDPIGLAAFQVTVDFDPDVLDYVSFELGDLLGSTGRQSESLPDQLSSGEVTVGAVTLPGAPGPSLSGELGTFTFHVRALGTSPLAIQDVRLADEINVPMDVTPEDAVVRTGSQLFLPKAVTP